MVRESLLNVIAGSNFIRSELEVSAMGMFNPLSLINLVSEKWVLDGVPGRKSKNGHVRHSWKVFESISAREAFFEAQRDLIRHGYITKPLSCKRQVRSGEERMKVVQWRPNASLSWEGLCNDFFDSSGILLIDFLHDQRTVNAPY